MNSTTTRTLAASVLAATLGLAQAGARNVDVSTLPDRDTVQLTIYNAEDLTLVRETRRITFRKGMNPLQFSWANTLIDPTSVDIRFKSHATKLDVLDTTFPHDKPQMLYWNVRSSFDGEAVVEISYFTSGITWSEDYAGAQVRLVVGEINLVEKIADLARRGLISNKERDAYLNGRRRGQAFEQEEARTEFFRAAGKVMSAPSEPKQIVKQGLSEYFIFTIPGQETVPNGWSKRMRLFEGQQVPFEIVYRYRPAEYGEQLVRLFSLRNDEKSKLGSTPLPNGIVRLFRDNGRDGLSFLTAYQTKYVPIGQEIELNLGRDPEVIHERIRLRAWRDNFWFRGRKPKLYFSPTKGHRIEPNYSVAGWDDNETWVERIRNYRDKPIQVEIRRSYGGHVIFASDLGTTLYDYRSPQFTARIAAAEERDLSYDLTVKQGINKKQDNVTLE
ncbi:MAG: hypothetical protein ACYTGM_18305 [Planctomycetota bacterium]